MSKFVSSFVLSEATAASTTRHHKNNSISLIEDKETLFKINQHLDVSNTNTNHT